MISFHAIAAGGDAIGRDETGRAIFAPYGAPGDKAQVETLEEKKSFSRAKIIHLETASPARAVPPCPYYLPPDGDLERACGGCQIQHLNYAAQLEAKRGIVRDALTRIGGLQNPNVSPCLPSPQEFGYRNKAEWKIETRGGLKIGFHARGTHHVVDVSSCPIQRAENDALIEVVREAITNGLLQPRHLRGLTTRVASDGKTLLRVQTDAAPWPQADEFAGFVGARVPHLIGVIHVIERPNRRAQQEIIAGHNRLIESVAGLRLRVSGDGFFQVNTSATPLLLETALRLADVHNGERALDLFCGVGLFALAMARVGARVLGIESGSNAVRDAVFNAAQNHLAADFQAGDAASALLDLEAGAWDLALLDPPRAGAMECMAPLASLKPRKIVYVSCDPATLARDIKLLTASGYILREAVPIDLFPQTAHVETVARLDFAYVS